MFPRELSGIKMNNISVGDLVYVTRHSTFNIKISGQIGKVIKAYYYANQYLIETNKTFIDKENSKDVWYWCVDIDCLIKLTENKNE